MDEILLRLQNKMVWCNSFNDGWDADRNVVRNGGKKERKDQMRVMGVTTEHAEAPYGDMARKLRLISPSTLAYVRIRVSSISSVILRTCTFPYLYFTN